MTTHPIPHCYFCFNNWGEHVDAEFLAAQSTDLGETIEWVAICRTHADGWNDGGDWKAPMYPIPTGSLVQELVAKADSYIERRDGTADRDKRSRFEHVAEAYRDAAHMVERAMAPIFDILGVKPPVEPPGVTTQNRVHFQHRIEKTEWGTRKKYLFTSTGRHGGSYSRAIVESNLEAARTQLRFEFPNAVF